MSEKNKENTVSTAVNERPRICLVDLKTGYAQALQSRGFNCYAGTLGPLVKVPNDSPGLSHPCLLNNNFPVNLHEYDIVIVDLQNSETSPYLQEHHKHAQVKGRQSLHFLSPFPETIFDPRPYSAGLLELRIRPVVEKESILIVFAAPNEKVIYSPVIVTPIDDERLPIEEHSLYEFYTDLPDWENVTGKDMAVVPNELTDVTALLHKHMHDTLYKIVFHHPKQRGAVGWVKNKNFHPLLIAAPEKTVSFMWKRGPNYSFFFPKIKRKQEFLIELLETILPKMLPNLFPYSTKFAWTKDHAYRLPNEENLAKRKDEIHIEYQEKLSEIDARLAANYQRYGFLHDLLTGSGPGLVKTVKEFLRWLGFKDVINVDKTNPALQEEDLRVEMEKGLLVIEVKGIGSTSTDSECAQISKIRHRRSKERGKFDVSALYCVNHQRFLPPENRQNPPFNTTQIKDALNDDRGLITTYDLFKLYFNIEGDFISKNDARKALLRTSSCVPAIRCHTHSRTLQDSP